MGQDDLTITSWVCVQNSSITQNDVPCFKSKASGVEFLQQAYEEAFKIDYPKFYKMDVLGKLGIIATDVLLQDFDFTKYQPEEVGIVLSNKNASIEADVNYFETAYTFPSPALFVYTLPNIVIGEISIRYKFKGENAFFISDGFDADWLHFYVNDLLKNQKIKACICGWLEATDDALDACLFLVEQDGIENAINFAASEMNKIYNF
ncbi:MAG: hypothetical protein ACK5NK_00965 [Niabella sp.]